MRSLPDSRKGCAGVFSTRIFSSSAGGHADQAVQLAQVTHRGVPRPQFPLLADYGGEEGSRIAAPGPIGAVVVGDQSPCELLYIVGLVDFGEQVPAAGSVVEGVEDRVAGFGVIEAVQVSGVGVGDDHAITARERAAEDFPDRGGLAGAGGADQFEVFGFIHQGDRDAGNGQLAAFDACTPAFLDQRAALVRGVRTLATEQDAGDETDRGQKETQNPVLQIAVREHAGFLPEVAHEVPSRKRGHGDGDGHQGGGQDPLESRALVDQADEHRRAGDGVGEDQGRGSVVDGLPVHAFPPQRR